MNQMTRRAFLKNSINSTFALAFLNPFNQLLAYSNNDNNLPSWIELVDYARWCPSVHNLQPHKLKIISETEAELYYDPKRLLPIGDSNSTFVTVAMGIFVENLSIAAAQYGLKVRASEMFNPISTNATEITLFARLFMTQTDKQEVLNRNLILKRKTSRANYDGRPLNQEVLKQLTEQTEKFEHDFFSSTDKELVETLVKLNQQTLFEDLESKSNRDELNKLFRYNKKDAETKKDGLWSKCMGFSGLLMKSVFVHYDRWGKGTRKKLLAEHYRSSFSGTSTICWIGGAFDTTHDWYQAGRMLARNWLLITKEGAFIQPFGSLITNKEAYKKINETFKQSTNDKKIWMIFRAGYSEIPASSYRLSTEEIIIK